MAATYLELTTFPQRVIAGLQIQFRLTALNVDGTVDTGFTDTVSFASTDPDAALPTDYAFVGGDAGTRLFRCRLFTSGLETLTASSGALTPSTVRLNVANRPPGVGFDDFGLLPYGDAAGGIGASLKHAKAISTREVAVDVSNLVQDNSPFLAGDALNPATWTLQRLDDASFLHVVSVTQTGTYQYTLLTLEEFGAASVTHRVSSSTLLDLAGNVIVSPRSEDFLGILDEGKVAYDAAVHQNNAAARDIANPQIPDPLAGVAGGSLAVGADGDYMLETGEGLVKKLYLRRLMSTPRDFFHLPTYGCGLRVKEPVPSSDLGSIKASVEQQLMQESESLSVNAAVTLASNGVLTVRVAGVLRSTGNKVQVGYSPNNPNQQVLL